MTEQCFLCNGAIPLTHIDERETYTYKCPTCGNVKITEEAVIGFSNRLKGINYLLSAFIRQRSDLGHSPLVISSSNALDFSKGAHIPRSVSQQLDLILLYLERKSTYAGQAVPLNIETDYPIAFSKHAKEFRFLVDQLISLKLIEMYPDRRSFALTLDGWKRLDHLQRVRPLSNQVFVAMWFADETKKAYEEAIYRAIDDTGYSPLRIDLIQHNEKIDDRIIAEIRKSTFLVADFTGHRGGVYFESGFAMGIGIPVIRTCRKDHVPHLHFDTRQYNHIVWETEQDLYQQLRDRIEATIVP